MRPFEIIIPHLQDQAKLEDTLVSVLQHRPAGCDVIVPHSGDYRDPYGLEDEGVRFVTDHESADLLDLIELAAGNANSDILHILEPGLEVVDGWWAPALEHFADRDVAAVAPLILESTDRQVVASAGLQFSRSGRHQPARRGARLKSHRRFRASIVGPHWNASFYRRSALVPLLESGCVVGNKLADLDWALQLADQGMRCVSEPQSHVHGQPTSAELRTVADGRNAQRLFLRHVSRHGSWLRHPSAWFLNILETLPSPATLALPLGRLLACLESKQKRTTRPVISAASADSDENHRQPMRRAA